VQIGQGSASFGGIAVFNPTIELFGGEAAYIRRQVGFRAGETTEAYKIIGAELVGIIFVESRGLRGSAPEICPPRTLLARPNAITPVIAVSETASRPTNDRGLNFSELFDQGAANAILIGDFGVFANSHPIVNDATEILGEVSVDVGRNRA